MSRILVVEDNPAILESLQSNLETDGYEVFVATRAAQALPLVAGQAPDLSVPNRAAVGAILYGRS